MNCAFAHGAPNCHVVYYTPSAQGYLVVEAVEFDSGRRVTAQAIRAPQSRLYM